MRMDLMVADTLLVSGRHSLTPWDRERQNLQEVGRVLPRAARSAGEITKVHA